MMSFEDALKKVDAGITIDIEVSPGSKQLSVPSGYNLWRERIEVRLSQNAQKGRANEQLVTSLAGLFQLRSDNISIVNGIHNSKKSILLENIEYSTVVKILEKKLAQH